MAVPRPDCNRVRPGAEGGDGCDFAGNGWIQGCPEPPSGRRGCDHLGLEIPIGAASAPCAGILATFVGRSTHGFDRDGPQSPTATRVVHSADATSVPPRTRPVQALQPHPAPGSCWTRPGGAHDPVPRLPIPSGNPRGSDASTEPALTLRSRSRFDLPWRRPRGPPRGPGGSRRRPGGPAGPTPCPSRPANAASPHVDRRLRGLVADVEPPPR